MRLMLCALVLILVKCCYAPPVTPDKSKEQDSETKDDLEDYMEYHRYLKEVVQALESDPEFRERLEKADQEDVKSGKIAEELDFVNHNVRSKLNEIKRRELVRLRHLATKQYELTNNVDMDNSVGPSHEHLDNKNLHTFEIEDLKRLIKKTTSDLEEIDKRRRQEFKEYEMQKEFEKHQKLESLDEQHKKEYQEKLEQDEKAKKEHKPLHHPGSKQQLEEVWEQQDHMDQQFDPKIFFMMHDVDGNGVWDADEVKALFIKELDKMYGPNGPNKDLHEREEEMERMREHVFLESDLNRDGLIDFNEFMMQTRRSEFQHDQGWQPIDERQVYTKDEYHAYEQRRLEELRYLQERGLVDVHGRPIPGAHHQLNQGYQQNYQQQYPVPGNIPVAQQYYHQGQMQAPGQPHAQMPNHGYPQAQVPMQGQMPVQGQAHGQMPIQGQAHGQMPVQGQAHGQIPVQGQAQGQIPVQGQTYGQIPVQNQIPSQGQMHGQIPVQGQVQNQTPVQGQMQGQIPGQDHKQNEIPVPGPTTYAKVPVPVQAESQLPVAGQAHGSSHQN